MYGCRVSQVEFPTQGYFLTDAQTQALPGAANPATGNALLHLYSAACTDAIAESAYSWVFVGRRHGRLAFNALFGDLHVEARPWGESDRYDYSVTYERP